MKGRSQSLRLLRIWCVLVAMFVFGSFASVSAQATSKSGPLPAAQHSMGTENKAKPPRVWTNDDIQNLRTPADNYVDKKANLSSRSPVDQKIASDNASPGQLKPATDGGSLPDDADAIEKLILQTNEDIRRKQSVLDKASADAESARSALERSELKSNEEIANSDLASSKEQLELLQAHLRHLKSQSGLPSPDQKPQNTP